MDQFLRFPDLLLLYTVHQYSLIKLYIIHEAADMIMLLYDVERRLFGCSKSQSRHPPPNHMFQYTKYLPTMLHRANAKSSLKMDQSPCISMNIECMYIYIYIYVAMVDVGIPTHKLQKRHHQQP